MNCEILAVWEAGSFPNLHNENYRIQLGSLYLVLALNEVVGKTDK